MDRRAFLAAVGGSTVALAGCFGSTSPSSGSDYDIGMSSARFQPGKFAVAPGTTVVWHNTSSHTHTVTAYQSAIPDEAEYFASGGFDSTKAAREGWRSGLKGGINPGDSFEHTFTIPGEYNYFCIPHEPNGMVGSITVSEDATRTPTGGRVTTTSNVSKTDSR
ncbi:MAG: plastocyanin/azurin family copper-binding protein [Halorientalis sp.]